jgi:hypothetical protein
MDRFDAWTRGSLTGISSLRIAPRWVVVATVGFSALLVVAFGALRSGELRGGLVFVGLWGLALLFMRTWLIATARTRRYLVSRPDWGDFPRLAALAGAFLLIPAVGAVALYAFLLLMGALDRLAKGS